MAKPLSIETSVKKLGTLLSEVVVGTISVPPFQRDYVWTKDRVKSLFDSIDKNYPIGSILLWKPTESLEWECSRKIGPYTLNVEQSEEWYVLDGFQRLSTMLGCLINPSKTPLECDINMRKAYFDLYYDLKMQNFLFLSGNSMLRPYYIPVYVLMSSIDMRQYTRHHMNDITDENELDLYLTRADALAQKIANFDIACIKIVNANISEAVEIFSRLNSKGAPISPDWMVNALSYSQGRISFSSKITRLQKQLAVYNFDKLSRMSLFRCFQSAFGKLYFDETNIEALAKRNDFNQVTDEIIPYIIDAVKFLHDEMKIHKTQLLPYPILLVFVIEFFRRLQAPTDSQLGHLREWVWKVMYSNYFTVTSLSTQRDAYNHFVNCLKNNRTSALFYTDNNSLDFSTMPFPAKVNLRAVRSKVLELFIIHNYSDNYSGFEDARFDFDSFISAHRTDIVAKEMAFVRSLGITYSESSEDWGNGNVDNDYSNDVDEEV